MNDLIPIEQNLPDTMRELARFVLVGREKLISVKAEIRAIEKLELAHEVIEQKRDEARMIAEAILDAEVKLGELFREIPKATRGSGHNQYNKTERAESDSGVAFSIIKPKREVIEELGFTKKQGERLETLADNDELVEYVKAEARKNGELPTRARVFELAAMQKNRPDEDGDFSGEARILDITAWQEANLDEHEDFIDLSVKVYKELAKINDTINRFEITEYRMNALRDSFDAVLTIENELRHLNNSIEKLNIIKTEIQKGKRYGKK